MYLVSKSYNNLGSSWSGEGATANLFKQYELFPKWYDMSHLIRYFSQQSKVDVKQKAAEIQESKSLRRGSRKSSNLARSEYTLYTLHVLKILSFRLNNIKVTLSRKQAPKAGGCARDLTDQTAESS